MTLSIPKLPTSLGRGRGSHCLLASFWLLSNISISTSCLGFLVCSGKWKAHKRSIFQEAAGTDSTYCHTLRKKRAAYILQPSDDAQIFVFLQHSVWRLKQLSPLHFSSLSTSVAHLTASLALKISRISRQRLYTTLCHFCSSSKKLHSPISSKIT